MCLTKLRMGLIATVFAPTLARIPALHAQQPVPGPSDSAPVLPFFANPTVSFAFERPGLPVPRFTLTLNNRGLVAYVGEEVSSISGVSGPPSAPQRFQLQGTLSSLTTLKVFTLAGDLHNFNLPCASKAKNVADSGRKTLTYTEPGRTSPAGSCTFNYTENKSVAELADMLRAIATTMDTGRELDRLHRYDRLGLDAAMASLAQLVSEGYALELGTIAPTLHSIAADPEVLERVRNRANTFLSRIPADTGPH